MYKELNKYLHVAGALASQLEEAMEQAEMVCKEDSDITQEIWQEVEERLAEAQSINSSINDLVETVAMTTYIKETG